MTVPGIGPIISSAMVAAIELSSTVRTALTIFDDISRKLGLRLQARRRGGAGVEPSGPFCTPWKAAASKSSRC